MFTDMFGGTPFLYAQLLKMMSVVRGIKTSIAWPLLALQ